MRVTILCLLLTAAAAPAAMIAQTEVIAYSPRSVGRETPLYGSLGIDVGTLGKPAWTLTPSLVASPTPDALGEKYGHHNLSAIRRKHYLPPRA
jgi:hypothetical protein